MVYICAEGASGFRKCIVAARRNLDLPDDTPFALISTPPDLGSANGDAEALIDCIREQSKALGWKPSLVVVDTLARSMVGADESNARDMGGFIANAGRIERELGVLVLVVHHTGKDIERGMRGSSALHGATSAEWEIVKSETEHELRVAKMKDGDDGQRFCFKMFHFEVGKNESGDSVTTLVVGDLEAMKQDETGIRTGLKPLKGQNAEFLKALQMAIYEVGQEPPSNEKIPAKQKAVTRKQLDLYAEKLGFFGGMTDRSRRSRRDHLIRNLAGNHYIGQWGDFIWLASETR